MSQFFTIFCRLSDPVPQAELEQTVEDAWYGEETPRVASAPDDPAATGSEWRRLEIWLPGSQRPILVERDADEAVVSDLIDETLEELGANVPAVIVEHLRSTRRTFGVEVFPEQLDEDAWELIDVLLSFLARRLDGIIVASDGIYDQDLKTLINRP